MGFPGGSEVKNLPARAGAAGDVGSIPGSVFLPGESHGQRSLAGCRLWGHKQSEMTECGQTLDIVDVQC